MSLELRRNIQIGVVLSVLLHLLDVLNSLAADSGMNEVWVFNYESLVWLLVLENLHAVLALVSQLLLLRWLLGLLGSGTLFILLLLS